MMLIRMIDLNGGSYRTFARFSGGYYRWNGLWLKLVCILEFKFDRGFLQRHKKAASYTVPKIHNLSKSYSKKPQRCATTAIR